MLHELNAPNPKLRNTIQKSYNGVHKRGPSRKITQKPLRIPLLFLTSRLHPIRNAQSIRPSNPKRNPTRHNIIPQHIVRPIGFMS